MLISILTAPPPLHGTTRARKSLMPVTIQKPPHGQPCNGCGQCCEAQMCPIGAKIFLGSVNVDYERTGPCPALETQDDGKRVCGVIKNPARYAWKLSAIHGAEKVSAALAHLVGAGQGCDAHVEGESYNHEFYHRMISDLDGKKSVKARKLWGV